MPARQVAERGVGPRAASGAISRNFRHLPRPPRTRGRRCARAPSRQFRNEQGIFDQKALSVVGRENVYCLYFLSPFRFSMVFIKLLILPSKRSSQRRMHFSVQKRMKRNQRSSPGMFSPNVLSNNNKNKWKKHGPRITLLIKSN